VFVRDPELRRHARAAEPDTSVLAVGGRAGEAYTPSAWESFFHAERHRPTGDFDAMADELTEALAQHPDNAAVLYNLACAEAQAGRLDDAQAHLARALELRPEYRELSDADDDLVPLRERLDLT
jgi:tetratricopeptide (TPR) repeat protein